MCLPDCIDCTECSPWEGYRIHRYVSFFNMILWGGGYTWWEAGISVSFINTHAHTYIHTHIHTYIHKFTSYTNEMHRKNAQDVMQENTPPWEFLLGTNWPCWASTTHRKGHTETAGGHWVEFPGPGTSYILAQKIFWNKCSQIRVLSDHPEVGGNKIMVLSHCVVEWFVREQGRARILPCNHWGYSESNKTHRLSKTPGAWHAMIFFISEESILKILTILTGSFFVRYTLNCIRGNNRFCTFPSICFSFLKSSCFLTLPIWKFL